MAEESRGASAIIVAAGSGRRFGAPSDVRKQYKELCGVPLLLWSIRTFLAHPKVGSVVVVLPPEDVDSPPHWLAREPVIRTPGGIERGDSVRNGLAALRRDPAPAPVVLIHDGARPLVTARLIDRVLNSCDGCGVIPGIPMTDTVKEIDEARRVVRTLDRELYRRVQTPQAFPLEAIASAHERAQREGVTATDDAALFERYGLAVRVVDGDPGNLKVTTTVDFDLAEILASRLPASDADLEA